MMITFPSQAIKDSQALKEQIEKHIPQKSGNHFLFLGLENNQEGSICSPLRRQLLRLLFLYPVRERDRWPGSSWT